MVRAGHLGAWLGCVGVVIWQQIVRFGLAALLLRESAAFVLAFGREGDLGDVPFLSAVGAADRMGAGWCRVATVVSQKRKAVGLENAADQR